MKHIFFSIIAVLIASCSWAQDLEDSISFIPWKKVVLSNDASFESIPTINMGSGFLFKYNGDTLACTSRAFTGTYFTSGKMICIKDFKKEMKYWKMYVSDNPAQCVMMDTVALQKRIEWKKAIITYSASFLTFALKEKNEHIIPLTPDFRKVCNKDTLYIVGYDNDHNLKIIPSVIENVNNEKYAGWSLRLRTNTYLRSPNYLGAPVVDKNGALLGLVTRVYYLYLNKKGRIVDDRNEVEGGYYQFYAEGTSMRAVLGNKPPK